MRLRPSPESLEGRSLMASFQGLGIGPGPDMIGPREESVSADGSAVAGDDLVNAYYFYPSFA